MSNPRAGVDIFGTGSNARFGQVGPNIGFMELWALLRRSQGFVITAKNSGEIRAGALEVAKPSSSVHSRSDTFDWCGRLSIVFRPSNSNVLLFSNASSSLFRVAGWKVAVTNMYCSSERLRCRPDCQQCPCFHRVKPFWIPPHPRVISVFERVRWSPTTI